MKSQNLSLYVVRLTAEGEYGNSAPCEDCTRVLRHYGIRYLIYSCREKGIVKMKFKNYEPYVSSVGRRYLEYLSASRTCSTSISTSRSSSRSSPRSTSPFSLKSDDSDS